MTQESNLPEVPELLSTIEELQKQVEVLQQLVSTLGKDDGCSNAPIVHSNDWSKDTIIKKPIMYLYNMSGHVMQCCVDLSKVKVVDSVPEIRKDQKFVFNLDNESIIANKHKYLYYELDAPDGLPKSSVYAFVRNDRYLNGDLHKLGAACGLYGEELEEFIIYWALELRRRAAPYFKCEILTEAKLDKLFPIEIDPVPDYFVRRYVKFIPAEKIGKSQLDGLTTKARMGDLRVVEWGGMIADQKTVK